MAADVEQMRYHGPGWMLDLPDAHGARCHPACGNRGGVTMPIEGFTNYATAGVALTLDNDRETWEQMRLLIETTRRQALDSENIAEGIWTAEQAVLFETADALQDYVERLAEAGDPTDLQSQLIRAGLSEVDWQEFAQYELDRAEEG